MDSTMEKLLLRRIELWEARLRAGRIAEESPLTATISTTRAPVPFAERRSVEGPAIGEGETWGAAWEVAWIHVQGHVPAAWRGRPVAAHLDLGGEGLVCRDDGEILQGISIGSTWDPGFRRDLVPLFDSCAGGEEVDLWVETSAAALFGVKFDLEPARDDPARHGRWEPRINTLRLAALDEESWHFAQDLAILVGLVKRLAPKSTRRARLLHAAAAAADRHAGLRERLPDCRAMVARELFRPASASAPSVTAVGHAHIDTAWLWPVDEGVRKCARTFSTQLRLLERYPDYVFGASQAQHYAFMKEHYPSLFAAIRRQVGEGRWEVQGGMWVEADCNLPDGESLVRQFLHGMRFFRDELGVTVDNLWLPDVFGYSAALPQILRRCGIDALVTQKISWNQFNEFPHTTFNWTGIDGSSVMAHFPPENTYNAVLDAETLIAGEENFRERGFLDGFLSLYGVGDGGGGPHEDHIERGRRMRDLEGTPRVRFAPASRFLHALRERRDELPSWVGELYLELHRGTLTSQAAVKRGNRRLEEALRLAELLHAAGARDAYPAAELDAAWKALLLNQFHDILPGSSINRVYQRIRREHEEALAACDRLAVRGAEGLCARAEGAAVLFQPHAHAFHGVVELPEGWAGCAVLDGAGQPLPVQEAGEGRVLVEVTVPGLSFATVRRGDPVGSPVAGSAPAGRAGAVAAGRVRGGDRLSLENDLVRYEFSAAGQLVSARDLESGRELAEPGEPGNLLTLHEDRPNNWDAWDVDLFHETALVEAAAAHVAEVGRAGPVRGSLRFVYRVGESEITQEAVLDAGSRRLDFRTAVEWRERHRILRVAFPVAVRASEASYEIQFGFLRRPTHRNTSWDVARFEAVAHRFIDLSSGTHGVALLNDSKYGHQVHGHILGLSLLRSPTSPDPDCDLGSHRFTYSLLPHAGGLEESEVFAEAAALNRPPFVVDGLAAGANGFPVRLEGSGLALAAFKKAEGDTSRIIRIVETRGRISRGRLHLGPAGGTIAPCDLVEWHDLATPEPVRDGIDLELGPFEIRTYRWREA
jgi:alpha-mannosidase